MTNTTTTSNESATVPQNELSPRETLKRDIIAYLKSVGITDREKLIKALDLIKKCADETIPIDAEVRRMKEYRNTIRHCGLKDGDMLHYRICWSFSPPHYDTIKQFVQRYEAIRDGEWAEQERIADTRAEYIEAQRELFRDEYEYGDVPGEVLVGKDSITISVRGYREGFKDALPQAGRGFYDGKGSGSWTYPNTPHYRGVFCASPMWNGCPVLYEPDATRT